MPLFLKDYSSTGSDESNCFGSDFERIRVYDEKGTVHNCYRYNAEVDSQGSSVAIKTSNKVGYSHGLHFYFYIPIGDFLNIFIGDTKVKPIFSEVYRFLDSGYTAAFLLNKLVEEKLGDPYNSCRSGWDYLRNSFLNESVIEKFIGFKQK